ncbi:adenylyltransferase/cytidyltransferase family protein [Streptomyces caatingaensis]|uniref:Cytidyltransferase n=1 Tax=Streptomyces caatingaensis TaxID=1678637 RepID=A0A0K9XBA4_9ACTN|nr:adenylyltransferase/cytidyltransferase family protein [Streptomyces caatingaensis]KNB50503.1 cytidyltransferase [Streptomyces caatingaensis]
MNGHHDGTPESAGLGLDWVTGRPRRSGPVVVTGVFDLLHVGHVRFLKDAASRGLPLVVGVEDDRRTAAWKGPRRPVQPEAERAEILAALECVEAVFVVHGDPGRVYWDDYAKLLATLAPRALACTQNDPYVREKQRAADVLSAELWEFPLTGQRSTTALVDRLCGRDV